MSAYAETMSTLRDYRKRIEALRVEMRQAVAAVEPEEVADYEFQTANGPMKLSQLFGAKKDLFVIHNMGRGCVYCTLWADGFNGAYDHLSDRAAFVVSSPDLPQVQKEFAESRGWRFPMVSHAGTTFAADMGYRRRFVDETDDKLGGWHPGVSVFRRQGDRILRVSDTDLGPSDDFCAVWHLFDLLPEGSDGWRPKYHYKGLAAAAE
jgi:predicted dithiol-disulfide oxidoreductase (DUF899 family)